MCLHLRARVYECVCVCVFSYSNMLEKKLASAGNFESAQARIRIGSIASATGLLQRVLKYLSLNDLIQSKSYSPHPPNLLVQARPPEKKTKFERECLNMLKSGIK